MKIKLQDLRRLVQHELDHMAAGTPMADNLPQWLKTYIWVQRYKQKQALQKGDWAAVLRQHLDGAQFKFWPTQKVYDYLLECQS